MNFELAYQEYLKYIEYRQKNQSKRTLKERFNTKILPFWKDYDIYSISASDYVKWQNEIEIFNYSNNYKKNLHYLMTGFFDYLIKYHKIKKNIPRLVGNFKMKNEQKTYNIYNYTDFRQFIKFFDNEIYKQFFILLFFTGLRPGEAMALRFNDLKDNFLSIQNTIDEHGNREMNSAKTLSSIRTIEIDKKLYKSLLKLKRLYKNKYTNYTDNFFIFGGIKPLSPTTINRYKNKACEKAGLQPIKLHEFRHSHATLLVEKKLMIKEVSRRLGHSNTNITLNTYTHATNRHEKKVIKTLNLMRLFY